MSIRTFFRQITFVLAMIMLCTSLCFAQDTQTVYTLGDWMEDHEFNTSESIYLVSANFDVIPEGGSRVTKKVYAFAKEVVSSENSNRSMQYAIPLVEDCHGKMEGFITTDMLDAWVNAGYATNVGQANQSALSNQLGNCEVYALDFGTASRGSTGPDSIVCDESLTVTFYASYTAYSLLNYNAYGNAYVPLSSSYKFTTVSNISNCTLYLHFEGQTSRYISNLSQIDEYAPYYERETSSPSLTANRYYICSESSSFHSEYPGLAFQIYGTGYYVIGAEFKYNGIWYEPQIPIASGSGY